MDLERLLNPASIAVVGATPRTETYAHETLRNLETLGYEGEVWGVHPRHREVRGRPVVPSLADLPAPADAVVVAVPAAAVPGVIEQVGETSCGGAVVIAAGFAEAGEVELEEALAAAARRHDLPVIGPNCDGIVRLHKRVALWGDSLRAQEAGPVALISQSGNLAVNALAARRGLRLHTVVSCGNQAVLDAGDLLAALVEDDGVRSIALYLEDDGDGPRLCEALARCAERDIGVAVLKAGASAAGAGAAATHTGALAGDHRVFRALVEEAGAAWARDAHELLELAKALAGGVRARGRGVGLVTCSGADSAVGADEAERQGVVLPPLAQETARRLRAVLPAAATVANPLDYTALVWGDVEVLRDAIAAVGADPAIDQVLVFFDKPPDAGGWAAQTWDDALEGIVQGAAASAAPVLMASTLPELLSDADAAKLMARGIPALQGLREGLRCALALRPAPPGAPARLRAIAGAARGSASLGDALGGAGDGGSAPLGDALGGAGDRGPGAADGRWLAEHEAKALLRAAGVAVVDGRAVADEDDAVRAAAELGWPVAVKRSSPAIRHKTEAGALALDVADEPTLRSEYRRLAAIDGHPTSSAVLVERMAEGAVELLVAARRDAVVPALVIALGGTWTELLDDVAVVPLPADPERVATAIRSLRGAPLLDGARGRPALDVDAAASVGAAAGRALLDAGLDLLELNPVLVGRRGAVVVDAVARARRAAATERRTA